MIRLAFRNLVRQPLRTALTLAGLSIAVAVLGCLLAFGEGYRRALGAELDRMGMQMMLVPLGCPYDAAARVLKGNTLENSLPESAWHEAVKDPAVAVAAPLLIAAVPRPEEKRTDVWVGLEKSALSLKPWWNARTGTNWFTNADSVILGADAASIEMRTVGDKFFEPQSGQTFRVAGILEKSGTSDDQFFFVPLATAQKMFSQPGRLTAIALRLRDPALIREAADRLQKTRGAQVVTLTEMMGTFLNLVGSVRTLVFALAVIAVGVSALGVFNTLLAAVVERAGELSLMRALGASRWQVAHLITVESLALTLMSSAVGLLLACMAGNFLEALVKRIIPFAPRESILSLTSVVALDCTFMAIGVGLLAAIYPAWRASRLQPATALRGDQ